MFEHDRSAARGEMDAHGLYVFKHVSELGNTHAFALFDRATAHCTAGVDVSRSIADYQVSTNQVEMPNGVTLIQGV